MMIITLLLSLVLLLFPSCSPESTVNERDIYLVTVADDGNSLETVITDQAALISQISTFSTNVHIYAFTAQNGNRYISTHPQFEPVDQKGNRVDDASSPSFDHFKYIAESADSTEDWTMDTVLDTVGSIHSEPDDLIIFTFSGHGDENGGALVTNVVNQFKYKLTNRETIITKFESIEGYKVFFLDSCYSGNFVDPSSFTTKDTFSTDEDRYTGEDTLSAVKNSSLEKTAKTQDNFWIMASAGKLQTANDNDDDGTDSTVQKHYGEFTYYLLKSLGYDMDNNQAKERTGELTFYGVYSYIRLNFPSDDIGYQTPRASLKRLDIRLR